MRVILDTNVLISALLHSQSSPAELVRRWSRGRYELLTSEDHLAELRKVTRYPKIAARIVAPAAGRLFNQILEDAIFVTKLPEVDRSPDRWDNFLLALAEAGSADFLVTGDKRDLLALVRHGRTAIVTVRDFLDRL